MDRHALTRRTVIRAGVAAMAAASGLARGQAKQPIRIGSTLALTGPLAATAQIHKIVGEIYIEQVNQRGGWLGRPLEWVLKDDQSKPDVARNSHRSAHTLVPRDERPRARRRQPSDCRDSEAARYSPWLRLANGSPQRRAGVRVASLHAQCPARIALSQEREASSGAARTQR